MEQGILGDIWLICMNNMVRLKLLDLLMMIRKNGGKMECLEGVGILRDFMKKLALRGL